MFGFPVNKARARLACTAVGIVLLVAGCEFLGLGEEALVSPEFHVSDGLSSRITAFQDTAQSSPGGALDAVPSLQPVAQVRSPRFGGTPAQTSHVSHDSESGRLYVGYKRAGDPFGGGIDVLDLQAGGRIGPVQSLRSSNVDVVEVRYDEGDGALFVAGAVNTRKLGAAPALLAKVAPTESGVNVKSDRLSDFVAKSLVLGPSPDHLHVVTDENALYQVQRDLKSQSKLTAPDAAGFRSVATHGSTVFVLDRSGRVFSVEADTFTEFGAVASLANNAFNERAIARLLVSNDRLFAALNVEGFSILSPSGGSVWTSGRAANGALYTCMATGPDHLFVGRRDGVIEIYPLPAGVPEQGTELEPVRTVRLWAGDVPLNLRSESVNQLLYVDGHLFVAYSTEGLLAFRVGS